MYCVYILQSESSGRFYTGHTCDLDDRLHRHNSDQSKSTRCRGPWKLVYTEYFPTRSEAQRREYQLKSKKSSSFIQKLISDAGLG